MHMSKPLSIQKNDVIDIFNIFYQISISRVPL